MHRLLALVFAFSIAVACPTNAVAQTPSVWSDFDRVGELVYLTRKSPSQIMRFDLAAEKWIDPISLTQIPTSLAVSDSKLYVAFDRTIKRYDLDGTNETHVANTNSSVRDILLDGSILFVGLDQSLYIKAISINTETFAQIDTKDDYVAGISGPSIAPSIRKIFGRSRGYSPSDINSLAYNEDGTFGNSADSPYHGDYPGASRTWMFPNESKVVDDSGTVYNTSDLTYNNSFGSSIQALAFYGADIPIALIGSKLHSYSNTLLETGALELELASPKDIVVSGDNVFVFYEDPTLSTKVGVAKVALEDLSANEPGEPISPLGLAYEIDDTAMDANGILYLLSKTHSSLFRWDTIGQAYLETIPLPEPCSIVSFAPAQNKLYLFAPERKLYSIDLAEETPRATHFANLSQSINTILPMGPDVLAFSDGSWNSQWLFGGNGALLKSEITCCYDNFHAYDETTQTLYYGSTHVTYFGNGEFGETQNAGAYDFNPIALSPDGQKFIDAKGIIFSASNREQIDVLSTDIKAAVWDTSNLMYTIKQQSYNEEDVNTTFQKWNVYNALEKNLTLNGPFVALHAYLDEITVVTSINGTPHFNVLTTNLNIASPPAIEAPVLIRKTFSATAARLQWNDVFGEQSYTIERSANEGNWTQLASLAFGSTLYTDVTLTPGFVYQYRIKAINGEVSSPYSNTISVDLTSIEDTRIDPNEIYFEPDDTLIGGGDIIYLLSKEHKSIFSWKARTCEWGVTIPLAGEPSSFTYSATNNALYTGYANGEIYGIGLAAQNPIEIPFAETPNYGVGSVIATGEFVAAYQNSGKLNVYDPAGALLDTDSYRYNISRGVWDPINRRIFHLRDGTSPNDLISDEIKTDGTLGQERDSPYHSSTGMQHPVRVHPNGSIVLLGSGRIYNTSTLEQIDELGKTHIDAAWIDGRLYTLQDNKIIAWNLNSYTEYKSTPLAQTGNRIFATQSGEIILLSKNAGQSFIDLLDKDLQPIAKADPKAPSGLRVIADSQNGFKIAWADVSSETGYLLERSSNGSTWIEVAAKSQNQTTANDATIEVGRSYSYRVHALYGEVRKTSETFEIEFVTPETVSLPTLTPLSETEIQIEWNSVGNALAYRVERQQYNDGWSTIIETGPSILTFNDSSLYRGTEYSYRITAVGIIGPADPSPVAKAFTLIDAPRPTSLLNVVSYTALQAKVIWDYAPDATSYRLERSKSEGGWTVVGEFSNYGIEQIDRSLDPDTDYKYRVIALNSGGESDPIESITFTTLALAIPATPSQHTAQLSKSEVSISWNLVTDADEYTVYRRAAGTSQWEAIATLGASERTYSDTSVWVGSEFEYSVSAKNDKGESNRSVTSTIVVSAIEATLFIDFESSYDSNRLSHSGDIVTNTDISDGHFLAFPYSTTFLHLNKLDLSYGGSLSFDLYLEGLPPGPITFNYWNINTNEWTQFQTLDLKKTSLRTWQNHTFALPAEMNSEEAYIAIVQEEYGYPSRGINLDNIIVNAVLPETPASPSMAFTRTNPAGGIAIFWIPTDRASTYIIQRSTDQTLWADLASVDSRSSHHIDSTAEKNTAYHYRIIAENKGGSAEPILIDSTEIDDQVTTAFEAGIAEVVGNPSDYGLSLVQTVSHVYFEISKKSTTLQGDLLSIPWIVYKSNDLINWTKHTLYTTLQLDEEVEASQQFFEPRPTER